MIFGLFGRKKANKSDPKPQEDPSEEKKPFLPFSTDIHSHLIPGIDDGSPSMERSLELLEGLEALGYRRIITTPHIMADTYRNTTETILRGRDRLREAMEARSIAIALEAAAEYYMDDELLQRLKSRDILAIGKEKYLLFETSYYNEPVHLLETIYEIAASGYRPMLAHPERYRYVKDYEIFYGRLKEAEVFFQININSLSGYYGREARQKALWLMERGWIDYLGSDLHGPRQLQQLRESIDSGILQKVMMKNRIINDKLI